MSKNCSFGYQAWIKSQPSKFLPKVTGIDCFALEECKRGLSQLGDKENDTTVTLALSQELSSESYTLEGSPGNLRIEAGCETGLLYGVYGFLFRLRIGESIESISASEKPAVSMRILNHWDNIDGSVERGYSGRSLFFDNGQIGYDPDRLRDYARLLSSVGINQISINNVNVTLESAKLVTEEKLPDVAKIADIFRPFGIKLIIAVHFESPILLGGIKTADPLDDKVAKWWQETAATVYRYIPDLAGFLMKADSEFRSGPASIGRTQAEGANVIAKALKPFGGTIYWRCFVYNCMQDWRDTKTDRPKAAYDYFYPLDGQFDDNVIVQIKHGPMDFQVREPNSPLLGAMSKTKQGLELQIAQEYTGQQIDLYATSTQWEEILNHPVTDNRNTRDLINQEVKAIVAVSNTGNDDNWTGHLLAQANLYAFGRLAWNPSLTADQVTKEWIALTFGNEPNILNPLLDMMLKSRLVYEKYNAPLGIGWMVNINHHYGPSVDGYEYMKWGTYHRANNTAIGVDRTQKGTGYTMQYQPYVQNLYENKDTCPENLLLFFHRLPYDYKLRSGRTLLQYIYDTHFEGVEDVESFIKTWNSLKEYMPEEAYVQVKKRLDAQLENAKEWRDVVNSYFFRKTGISDEKGRKIYE
ncbi:MAG: alpha-glucuronidase [Defluviitaleaceae bacterium]|nr:alpha-glucuronidase [Defluviitaleaceae bacterium]